MITLCWLLRRVWRGQIDWIDGAGWATLAMLVASSSLLPWYVAWLLPLAALGRDRRLATTAIVLTGVVQGDQAARLHPARVPVWHRASAGSRRSPYDAAMSDAPRIFDGEPRELSLVSVVAPVYNEDAHDRRVLRARLRGAGRRSPSSSCSSTTAPPTARR